MHQDKEDQFIVCDASAGRPLAVIQARDALQAQGRFERVRKTVDYRSSLRVQGYYVRLLENEAPPPAQDCPRFTDKFFELLNESERLKQLSLPH